MQEDDDKLDAMYMRRCVELASTAMGRTSPNPMVGCVIVKDGKIVGEGFHPKAGQPHAEVFALRDAGHLAEGATAYVSLEPCNHYGRTPPCTEALVAAKVKRVVVGMVDPNPIVASKGVDKLRGAGIDVTVGVEEELCKRLNEGYIHQMLSGKPFLALRDAPQLATVLREMREGLDAVRTKVEALTAKVKADSYPTADGISYLETKHLLLISYCQSLVYYLLRKAKGFSIEGHPVVRSLVEIRLFLEKIWPIDKKLQYQIQKLTKTTGSLSEQPSVDEKKPDGPQKTEDLLSYRPNPDMLISKYDEAAGEDGIYKPPRFAPVHMEESKPSKEERNASRKEKHMLKQASENTYMKEVLDDIEGRPEEVRETVGAESKELKMFTAKRSKREQLEEELFTRASLTRADKKMEKHLKKSRNGLMGLTENFYDDIKFLSGGDTSGGKKTDAADRSRGMGMRKKKETELISIVVETQARFEGGIEDQNFRRLKPKE